MVLNSAAWVITQTFSYIHITSILQRPYCLSVNFHMIIKTVHTFKAIHSLAPPIFNCPPAHLHPRPLSQICLFLHPSILSSSLTTMGSRAFCRSAPQLWNLPLELQNTIPPSLVKSDKKTHFFHLAYHSQQNIVYFLSQTQK